MAELTDEQAIARVGPPPPEDAAPPAPPSLTPRTDAEAAMPAPVGFPLEASAVATLGTSGTRRNVAPEIGDTRRRQQALGEQPGVPFHEEGLPEWTDLMVRARQNEDEKIRYLAKKFGPENVRLNEFKEPVVRIVDPKTGKPEDFPMNPRQLTVRSLNVIAKVAPEIAGAFIGEALAPELAGHALINTISKAALTAAGMEAGGAAEQIGAEALSGNVDVTKPILEHLANVPVDFAANLGLAGIVKGGQAVKGLGFPKMLGGGGINLPNPVAGTPLVQPARPEFTRNVLEAAARNQARSGINPNLTPAVRTGIPIVAMIQKYLERKPAGAAPQIAAIENMENAAKDFQSWMTDPSTLPTDEEVGRSALGSIERTIKPLKEDVEIAKFKVETIQKALPKVEKAQLEAAETVVKQNLTAAQQAKVVSGMRVSDIPTKGVDLAPSGNVLRAKAVADRDAFKAQSDALYEAVYANPNATAKVIKGGYLKRLVDQFRATLPSVEKTVEGETKNVPISTPIRPRLDELSAKLEGGTVSINDLKQIRTDIGDAILQGEAIPGVKEGRLKNLYNSLTDAISNGLKQIDDPELSKAWKEATTYYRENVDKFTEKNVARFFKDASQTASVGDRDFAERAISNQDVYTAARQFYGLTSPEMMGFRDTVRKHVLQKSVNASDGMIDPNNLARQLEHMRDTNQQLFKDSFANNGDALITAVGQLGEMQRNVPIAQVEKLLAPAKASNASAMGGALLALQVAERRLNKEYQNEIVRKFLKGDAPLSELRPDTFVSSLPDAKLSDVTEIMRRLNAEDPEVAEQVRRKAVQDLMSRSRRHASAPDTMAKLEEQPGDLLSGSGLEKAMGDGDQLKKYKVILGNLYEPLRDAAKVELGKEYVEELARGTGILVSGSAVGAIMKLLKPWESKSTSKGIMREMGSLAVDKVFSIFMASDAIRNWMASPYALKDASGAIKVAMVSEPFWKGMLQEFGKSPDTLAKVASILKVATGTASDQKPEGQQGALTDQEALRRVPQPQP